MEIFGYAGKILRVNLSNGRIRQEPLDSKLIKNFLGGRGFGAKLLFDELEPRVDPFSIENKLVIATGPFTGTPAPKSCKCGFMTKSPLTNAYLDSYVGGNFGPELKFAGYDLIIIEGACKDPRYLLVDSNDVEIRNASHIWGRGTHESQSLIREELGDNETKIATIGPAGERLVRFASITNEGHRQAGRGGAGAVMGAKRLKAIAVHGTQDLKIADPEAFTKKIGEMTEKTLENAHAQRLRKIGTIGGLLTYNEWGLLPTKNYQTGSFDGSENLDKKAYDLLLKNRACFGCPIACAKLRFVREGEYAGTMVEGPEYETACMLGSNCGNNSLEAVIKANSLCDEYGLDTISTGSAIAFAMECMERDLISETDTGGITLSFGDFESEIELIRKIAYRLDIGNVLAEGVERASVSIGKGAEKYAVSVKGLELPAYDPRGAIGMGLAYAISDTGGSHSRSWPVGNEKQTGTEYIPDGKAQMVLESMRNRTLHDILGTCRFISLSADEYSILYKLLTGLDISGEEMICAADRIYHLTRAFNVREGMTRRHDRLPRRLMDEPLLSGYAKGQTIRTRDFERMLDEYYKLMGWDIKTGIPTIETLRNANLADIAVKLKRTLPLNQRADE